MVNTLPFQHFFVQVYVPFCSVLPFCEGRREKKVGLGATPGLKNFCIVTKWERYYTNAQNLISYPFLLTKMKCTQNYSLYNIPYLGSLCLSIHLHIDFHHISLYPCHMTHHQRNDMSAYNLLRMFLHYKLILLLTQSLIIINVIA